ncbi:TetR/AcrR family transcriptional regulator [Sphingomonas sp. CFBP8993]|uniref:TetR/AcrR family transcriptional regulator n=1 Tax=Sphingomonas sp. CFBP8993 TaxID=3096526 RepID=UPI002A6B5816|nr:TetR/AcrR family transcriptional regulator [Sphingomonas sp. CFBP8993]MDY0957778.1 TetR/AcrR family transcriptional regulator [Sphingomonas sp. CFBP8993]
MTLSKPSGSPGERGEPVRQRVLEAAERLLRSGKAGFSMRDLAAEAGVSFATPFNQFGSKAGVMHALSGRRIETMAMRYTAATPPADRAGRVRLAVTVAVAVMLEEPDVNRAVMGSIGTAGLAQTDALERSAALWALALTGEDSVGVSRGQLPNDLPRHLALAFRGALSFWCAGELPDDELREAALAIADALMRSTQEWQPPLTA